MRRRRPTLPGVTAAATTAVFATGAGPGVTALATTAVLATGWPMTPTLPTRAGLRGTTPPDASVATSSRFPTAATRDAAQFAHLEREHMTRRYRDRSTARGPTAAF